LSARSATGPTKGPLSRRYTAGDSGRQAKVELSRYASVALFARGVNYLVFLGACAVAIHLPHVLAAAIGALAATGFPIAASVSSRSRGFGLGATE